MIQFLKTASGALFAVMLFLTATVSAPLAQTAQFEQVPLTEDSVSRFLASYPELKAVSEKYERDRDGQSDKDKGPLESLSGYMKHQKARGEMQAIFSRHGFEDFQDWGRVAQSVAIAYGFVKSGQSPEDINEMTGKALAQIQNNPNLSAEQKEQMAGMVRQHLGMIARIKPLPENLELVRSMEDEIAAVMDSDQR